MMGQGRSCSLKKNSDMVPVYLGTINVTRTSIYVGAALLLKETTSSPR
jgi:hypothetical protein